MQRHQSSEVAVVGLAGRDRIGPMEQFVSRYELGNMVHAADLDGSLWDRFGIPAQPAWVFINDDGRFDRRFGSVSGAALDDVVEALANQ